MVAKILETLEDIRPELDQINVELADLMERREAIIDRVTEVKRRTGEEAFQPERLRAMMDNVAALATARGLDPHYVQDVFGVMHDHSVRKQSKDLQLQTGAK